MTRANRKKKTTKTAHKGNGATDPSKPGATPQVVIAVKSKDFGLTGPVIDDETGTKSFSKDDLIKYDLAQHKFANASQASRIKKLESDDYQRVANQKLASMQSMKKQLDAVAKQRGEELTQMQAAIAEKYQVDLSKVTYDDETGRITEPPPDAVGSQPAA